MALSERLDDVLAMLMKVFCELRMHIAVLELKSLAEMRRNRQSGLLINCIMD